MSLALLPAGGVACGLVLRRFCGCPPRPALVLGKRVLLHGLKTSEFMGCLGRVMTMGAEQLGVLLDKDKRLVHARFGNLGLCAGDDGGMAFGTDDGDDAVSCGT